MNNSLAPLVSIIVPCFNHSQYIEACLQSIVAQDYTNLELIVIDDGSSDDSVHKINKLVQGVKYRFVNFEFRARCNRGVSETLNEGIDWASGKYVSFLASDDVIKCDKISVIVDFFEKLDPNFAAVFGDADFIGDDGCPVYLNNCSGALELKPSQNNTNSFLSYFALKRSSNYRNPNWFGTYATLLESNYIPAMGGVIRMESLRDVGGLTKNIKIEDWDLWLKLSRNYLIALFPSIVASYRLHGNNTVLINSEKMLIDSMVILDREEEYAVSNGFKNEFQRRRAKSVLGLIRINPVKYFSHFSFFLRYRFVKASISVLIAQLKTKISSSYT